MKATPEQIQIVNDHMIRMANYPKKNLKDNTKRRFREEINRCQYWLLMNNGSRDIIGSMVETKLIQAEMDGRLFEVKNFIGII